MSTVEVQTRKKEYMVADLEKLVKILTNMEKMGAIYELFVPYPREAKVGMYPHPNGIYVPKDSIEKLRGKLIVEGEGGRKMWIYVRV